MSKDNTKHVLLWYLFTDDIVQWLEILDIFYETRVLLYVQGYSLSWFGMSDGHKLKLPHHIVCYSLTATWSGKRTLSSEE